MKHKNKQIAKELKEQSKRKNKRIFLGEEWMSLNVRKGSNPS